MLTGLLSDIEAKAQKQALVGNEKKKKNKQTNKQQTDGTREIILAYDYLLELKAVRQF